MGTHRDTEGGSFEGMPVSMGCYRERLLRLEQGMYREVASGAGCPSIQDVAEALHILACRPYGEDHCSNTEVVPVGFILHLKTSRQCHVQNILC